MEPVDQLTPRPVCVCFVTRWHSLPSLTQAPVMIENIHDVFTSDSFNRLTSGADVGKAIIPPL